VSASVAAIAPVVPVAASAPTSSATDTPSGGFGAALTGAISEQSGNDSGSRDGASNSGKEQGQAESGSHQLPSPGGDAVSKAGASAPPAVTVNSGTPVAGDAGTAAQASAAKPQTPGDQAHPLSLRQTGPPSVGSGKSAWSAKRAASTALPDAAGQLAPPPATVPTVQPTAPQPSNTGATDHGQNPAPAQAQAADAQASALAEYQAAPVTQTFSAGGGTSPQSLSSPSPRISLAARVGAAMTASTSAVGMKTSGSSAASASSPLASALSAPVPGASTVAGTAVAQTGPAAPAGLPGDQRTVAPAHPSSESTPAIQLPVSALPVEHLAPVSPVVSPQPAAQAAPLQQQLARPMIRLASAENGAHTLVVRVAPDDLGPVTIQAHISDAGVKIELFAPNDAGREAIKQILPELRRDLTSTAANGSVSVSDQNAPSADERARQPRAAPQDGGSRAARDLPNVSTLSPLSGSSAYALDVFA